MHLVWLSLDVMHYMSGRNSCILLLLTILCYQIHSVQSNFKTFSCSQT